MSLPTSIPLPAQRRLEQWGVVEIIGDFRGATIEEVHRLHSPLTGRGSVTVVKRRSSFGAECLDCGETPHVSPDEGSYAVCLRCGRDRWL